MLGVNENLIHLAFGFSFLPGLFLSICEKNDGDYKKQTGRFIVDWIIIAVIGAITCLISIMVLGIIIDDLNARLLLSIIPQIYVLRLIYIKFLPFGNYV